MAGSSTTSETSLGLDPCFRCPTNALQYFTCSRQNCPGGANRRIQLCNTCACNLCPFCESTIQLEDLRTVTNKPTTLSRSSAEQRNSVGAPNVDLDAAVNIGCTLEEYNKKIQESADEVQAQMRKLKRELGMDSFDASDHSEVHEVIKKAEAAFEQLETDHSPDSATYRWLISMYARGNEREKVERWGYKMEEARCWSTDGYNALIFSFASLPKGIDRADMWFNRMVANGLDADAKSYNLLIQGCVKSQDRQRAMMYFERMKEAGLKADRWTFSWLIKSCEIDSQGSIDLQLAEQLWDDMRGSGEKPFDFTFKCLLKVCADAGNVTKASYFFEQMLEACVTPDVVIFTSVMAAFIETGDVRGVEEWFEKMRKAGIQPNVVAFTCVMTVCGKAGDVDKAVEWLGYMQKAGLEPSDCTFRSLMEACLNRGDLAGAEKWLRQMMESGTTPSRVTFNMLFKSCAKIANSQQIEKWFSTMQEAGVTPDVETFNILLGTCGHHQSSFWRGWRLQTDGATRNQQRWFFQMAQMGVQPNETTFAILTRTKPPWLSLSAFVVVLPLALTVVLHRLISCNLVK